MSTFVRFLDKDGAGTSFFPSLVSIECHNFDFDLECEGDMEMVKRLARILKNWPEIHPLRHLHIVDCSNFINRDRDFLQKELPRITVTWDGKQNLLTFESEDSDTGEGLDSDSSGSSYSPP